MEKEWMPTYWTYRRDLLKKLLHCRELFKHALEGSSMPLKSQYWWLRIHHKTSY